MLWSSTPGTHHHLNLHCWKLQTLEMITYKHIKVGQFLYSKLLTVPWSTLPPPSKYPPPHPLTTNKLQTHDAANSKYMSEALFISTSF
jgi:hypothetical protein